MKIAAAGLAHDGGKSVLIGDPRMPAEKQQKLIRALARVTHRAFPKGCPDP